MNKYKLIHEEYLKLCEIPEKAGGGTFALVVGRGQLFYAGHKSPPVKSLLESILAFLAHECYDKIAVFSEPMAQPGMTCLLPDWPLTAMQRVGQHRAGWYYRNRQGQKEPEAPPAEAATPDEDPALALMRKRQANRKNTSSAASPLILIPDTNNQNTEDGMGQLDALRKYIESETGISLMEIRTASERPLSYRSLLLVDERYWLPKLTKNFNFKTAADAGHYSSILELLPAWIEKSKLDIVIFSENNTLQGIDAQNVYPPYEGPMENIPKDLRLKVLHWEDKLKFLSLPPLNQTSPLSICHFKNIFPKDKNKPNFKPKSVSSKELNLKQTFSSFMIIKPENKVSVPADPRYLDLNFWSTLDLDSLRDFLHSRVLGQRQAIEIVLRDLERLRTSCVKFLNKGVKVSPKSHDKRDLAPSIMLMGESGMGKTHLAKMLAEYLFGSNEQFFEVFDMSNTTTGDCFIGSDKGFVGYGDAPPFAGFCQRNMGMGVAVFDEFPRVKGTPGKGDSLANKLEGYYPITDKVIKPSNPEFANFNFNTYFPNMLVVFTGNIYDPNNPDMKVINSEGFFTHQELGTPFNDKIQSKAFFQALKYEELPKAFEFFIKKVINKKLEEYETKRKLDIDGQISLQLTALFKNNPQNNSVLRAVENFTYDQLNDDLLHTLIDKEGKTIKVTSELFGLASDKPTKVKGEI